MKKIYYCKIAGRDNRGLCNQLFSLINGIIIAIKLKKEVIIVDEFQNDYIKKIYTSISKIINIEEFNNFLETNYNIRMVDKNDVRFKINTVYYGSNEYKINITDTVINKCIINNTFLLSNKVDLNVLVGEDPIPFCPKTVFINYSINNYILEETFEEAHCYLKDNIIFNLNCVRFKHTFLWMDVIDKNMFDNILQNIIFNDTFYRLADAFLKENEIDTNKKINVLHLRLESDALNHWSKKNNLPLLTFKNNLEEKYIKLIKNNIKKDEINIVLSYSSQNKVTHFLRDEGYKYFVTNKNIENGREISALIDLIIGNICNNVFIGNFNLNLLNGSSLSYYLIQNFSNKKIKLGLIDLDRIFNQDAEIQL
jgi:hypothetical protein